MKRFAKILALVLVLAQLGGIAVYADGGSGMNFTDVKTGRWSYDYIRYAVENGYMNGVAANRFDPAGSLSRAMVVTVLWRIAGSPAQPAGSNPFSDVKAGKWYTDAIIWASVNDIVNGVSADAFKPDSDITREQLAAIFYRFAEFRYVKVGDDRKDLSSYKDAKRVSSYAKDAMSWANAVDLIGGVSADTLQPRGNATREQFAAILKRFCDKEQDGIDGKADGFSFELAYTSPVVRSTFTGKEYPLVKDADVYVSPNGSDSAPGTLEKPVGSFAAARDLVREIRKTKKGDVTVAFMAGEYGRLEGLTLTSDDGGSADGATKYVKYGDGEVVFNNGATLPFEGFKPLDDADKSLFPEKSLDKIKKISLDGVFENGIPEDVTVYCGVDALFQARMPNKVDGIDDYYPDMMETVGDDPHYPGVCILPPASRAIDKIKHMEDAKLVGYLIRGYRVDSFDVTGYDKTTGILTFDPDSILPENKGEYNQFGIRTPGIGMDEFYIANCPDLLDAAGEYWCDNSTNTLYVYAPKSEINIALGGNFLTLDDADYVTLEGLTFRNCLSDNCINIRNSEHVTIDGCVSKFVMGPSSIINLTGDSDYLTVRNCEFSSFINHAIMLKPTRHVATLESNGIVIDNNSFHDFGKGSTFANQAVVDCCIGTVISHNEFRNSESGAINLGFNQGQNQLSIRAVIEYNVFTNLLYGTHDYGIIYIYEGVTGRENTVRYNLFYDNPVTGSNYCFYIDDQTEDVYVYGNIFYDSSTVAVMLHNVRDIYVYDNIFIDSTLRTNGMVYVQDDGTLTEDAYTESGKIAWYNNYLNKKIKEGEEGYELWKKEFPSLFDYYYSCENITDKFNLQCPWNSIHDNAAIGEGGFTIYDFEVQVGDVHDNVVYEDTENPFFVDPTHGNYTVRGDADFFKIPFEMMGRY